MICKKQKDCTEGVERYRGASGSGGQKRGHERPVPQYVNQRYFLNRGGPLLFGLNWNFTYFNNFIARSNKT